MATEAFLRHDTTRLKSASTKLYTVATSPSIVVEVGHTYGRGNPSRIARLVLPVTARFLVKDDLLSRLLAPPTTMKINCSRFTSMC